MNKKIRFTTIEFTVFYIIILLLGVLIGLLAKDKKLDKLQKDYNELQQGYEILRIEYNNDLESCWTLVGNLYDRVELGDACYIDGGLVCE